MTNANSILELEVFIRLLDKELISEEQYDLEVESLRKEYEI